MNPSRVIDLMVQEIDASDYTGDVTLVIYDPKRRSRANVPTRARGDFSATLTSKFSTLNSQFSIQRLSR
jgi:hypothetical protein